MMSKIKFIFLTVFLMVILSPDCERGEAADQPVIHVSQRVKIKRPEKPAVVNAELKETPTSPSASATPLPVSPVAENPAQAEATPNQPAIANVDQEIPASPPDRVASVSAEVQTGTSPEAPASPPVTPAAIQPGGPELGDATDLIGEKEALFGDQEKYYVKKGRIDPFKPFLNKPEPKLADIQAQEPERRTPRTPLERIALGQLKLTAVMRLATESQSLALVEDNNGKGYVVKQGTYIGEQGGLVSDIRESKLIIEETYKDVFGKASVRQIELKLQKQPGE